MILLGFIALIGPGCGSTLARNGQADRLYELAGVPGQISALVEAVALYAAEQAGGLDLDPGRRLRVAISATAEPSAVDAVARASFASDWQRDAAQTALHWYTSPTGERMRDLELRANEVDWDAALSDFVDEIIREPVPLHRVALLARLAEATQAAESTAELETGVARIVLRGVQILVSGDASTDDADLFLRLSAVYDGAIGRSRMQESIVFQFVYYAASDEEIEQYVLFAESPAGQWIIARDRAALAAAVDWLERRLRGLLEEAQPSAAA
ncbi:MAG: hypothetical protein JRH17_10960 [Deltaproteobacteria bacterium]|nr:hypothetical protein [Deltaproteobacteria bacterium]